MINKFTFTTLVVLLTLGGAVANAADKSGSHRTPTGTNGTPVRAYLDINNISTVFTSYGISDIDAGEANSGFVFPKGSHKTAVYESGFLWGGKVAGEIRVGGSAYRTGLQTGKILPSGVAEDPNLPKNRIYRVRPDYKTGSMAAEMADQGATESDVRAQYEKDWNEWPATDGAPYTDVDHNGVYNPATDIPGYPGADQTIWYVANDLDAGLTTQLYGTNPVGLELQVTVWAYAQQGALGNMLFRKYVLINKGAATVDSMYVSQWSDVDDGNSTDDYAGCDTTLSLGFTYNAGASDATYDPLPPPAVGFDFFQGPVVPAAGDSAIFLGKRIHDKKNLGMTAFYYFARGDAAVTDPTQGSAAGAAQFYNFFQGKIGLSGDAFTDPNSGAITKYALFGDPATGRGWVDGQLLPPGDRRMGLASGPFTMAPGDTQEVVVAEIAAGAQAGLDNISAIGLLKFYDKRAQSTYNNFFSVANPPPGPKVTTAALNNVAVLYWGTDTTAMKATENYNSNGYAFEGYNVYQLPSPSATLRQAKKIATYDVINSVIKIYDTDFDFSTGEELTTLVQKGPNTGIARSFEITNDALNGGTLVNGKKYYFAVTAYNYNPDPLASPNNLESPLNILTVVPHSPDPGVRYGLSAGDTAGVLHYTIGGATPSEGLVLPIIVDPTKTTGDRYTVTFDTAGGSVVWSLKDSTKGKVLVSKSTNQSGDATYLITDGMQVRVSGPATPGMKDWDIPAGARRWTWANADGFGLEGFNGAIGNAELNWFSGSSIPATKVHNVLIKFAAVDSATGNILNLNDPNVSMGYRYLRHAAAPAAKPEFAPFIIHPTGGYAFQIFEKNMPFAAFDEETGQRLNVGFLETNDATGLVDGHYYPPSSDISDNNAGAGAREFFFIFGTTYSTESDPALAVDILNTETPMMWMGTPDRRGQGYFQTGDQFEILANHLNSLTDVFSFNSPAVTQSSALAKTDVSQINVFPNPYYGVNTQEINKYQKFVTFSHLPVKATIRIFNLAGVMVRTINKTDATTQFQRWDLANESGLPVASGLYIAHIDMGDLGTKIVKFSIIQERQILDRF